MKMVRAVLSLYINSVTMEDSKNARGNKVEGRSSRSRRSVVIRAFNLHGELGHFNYIILCICDTSSTAFITDSGHSRLP